MAVKQDTKRLSTRLSEEQREQFFAYLDAKPEHERPVFAFMGRKSGLWHQMGGGTAQMLVAVYPHWIVFSTRGLASAKKEKGRVQKPLEELTEVKVLSGPLFASVQFRFKDGTKTKIANVNHAAANRMAEYQRNQLRAFERSRLDEKALSDFWFASWWLFGNPAELSF